MENDEQPDLFPDLPRAKRGFVQTHKQLLNSELKTTREAFGVTTPHIGERLQIPSRTIENWMHGTHFPPEWACRLVRVELRKLFPR